jgi:hypothetical protein
VVHRDGLRDHLADRHPGTGRRARLLRPRSLGDRGLAALGDVTYNEDRSRTGSGPRVLASLRNLAITILRLAGHANVAAALRYHARNPGRPLQTIMQC